MMTPTQTSPDGRMGTTPTAVSGDGRIRFFHADCMSVMKAAKDGEWDLAVCDPPYKDEFTIPANCKAAVVKKHYNLNSLNNSKPTPEYFKELKRVSKNQIIWGVNYYEYYLGAGRIVWDKDNTGVYSDCELAYQSFSDVTRKFKWTWNGMLQGDMKNKQQRIHPTEKPIQLYQWLLQNYAKPGMKILDTHGGSMSSAIASDMEGYEMDIVELDVDYFQSGWNRFSEYYTKKTEIAELGYARTELSKIHPLLF